MPVGSRADVLLDVQVSLGPFRAMGQVLGTSSSGVWGAHHTTGQPSHCFSSGLKTWHQLLLFLGDCRRLPRC